MLNASFGEPTHSSRQQHRSHTFRVLKVFHFCICSTTSTFTRRCSILDLSAACCILDVSKAPFPKVPQKPRHTPALQCQACFDVSAGCMIPAPWCIHATALMPKALHFCTATASRQVCSPWQDAWPEKPTPSIQYAPGIRRWN